MCLGIPGRIIEIRDDAGLRMGIIDFGGVRREVCLAYLDEDTRVGEYAIVHAGFAISRVHEEEARRTYELLIETGWTGEEELPEAAVSGKSTEPASAKDGDAGGTRPGGTEAP